MAQSAYDWYIANYGAAPSGASKSAGSVSVTPSGGVSWGAAAPSAPPTQSSGPQKVYGSDLATGIAQSQGVNPSSLPKDQYGGVTQQAMSQAIAQRLGQPNAAAQPKTPAPTIPASVQEQLTSLWAQNRQLQQQLQNYQSNLAQVQQPVYTSPITTPTSPAPTPNPITSPISTTGVQTAQQENPDLGIAHGTAGFSFAGAVPGSASTPPVSPDATYNLWKRLNSGKDNTQMQAYFNSPDWMAVASGNIPLWMANDNSWRAFLTRLGYMSPSYNTDMENAIKSRLAALNAQKSATTSST